MRRYFDSIRHDILKAQLCRIIKDCRCLSLLFTVIDGYSVGGDAGGDASDGRKGLPIGNLTSQFFANLYLSPLDHYILEQLHPSGYVRYMDDMLLFADSREAAGKLFCAVESFCSERLGLHLREPVLGRCADGVPFLGWRISPGGVRVLSRSRRRMRATLRALGRDVEAGRLSEQEAASRADCMAACRRL